MAVQSSRINRIFLGFVAILTFLVADVGSSLHAQSPLPVAIVEEASDDVAARPFDYLREGDEIILPVGSRLVVGYLASCRRETIEGGIVAIGTIKSTVTGGQLKFEQVNCDGGQILLDTRQVQASGVIVFRGGEDHETMVYSATPVISLSGGGTGEPVEIRRLDRTEAVVTLPFEAGRGGVFEVETILTPGGLYEVRHGERTRRIRIVVYGRRGGPLLGRLVVL